MENATKALIIAAAVLISILLISLGVGVFNSAQEQMGKADLSEYEVQKFNDKFTKYIGTNKKGSDINALAKTVLNHNLAQDDATTCVEFLHGTTVLIDDTNTGITLPAKVPNVGTDYTVTAEFGDDGIINSISY